MIDYKKLDVEYDQIVILDLLSDDERTNWKITEELNSVLTTEGFSTRILNLSTKQELLDAINQLTIESHSGKRYMLHFVGHGNSDCIGFKHTGELIPWSAIEEPLRHLNKASNGSVVLNMTTCKGLNVINAVDQLKGEFPFFGIIGYSENLGVKPGINANKIFYLSMANGMQIQEAIEKVKKDTGDEKFHCITAQGYAAIKNKIEQQK
ncbi:caspase family protein [Psychroflexus tropicus]|uniref:caspase family protein n=1 Tax=Psychroflexus tropicus TaxID=197345 RepID=UPI000376D600|nr:caspase family protein [Psychroflexus tropicus]